jgi:hypothetical protein
MNYTCRSNFPPKHTALPCLYLKCCCNTKSGRSEAEGRYPRYERAVETATTHTKPAFAGFRNKGGDKPGFGITQELRDRGQ